MLLQSSVVDKHVIMLLQINMMILLLSPIWMLPWVFYVPVICPYTN